MKILLVDDSRTMRTIQKRILSELGTVEFSEAGDGDEALRLIGGCPGGFNLVLVDWNMPNMDGLTLVTQIRASDKKTPLLMVTTEAEESRVKTAIQAGVTNYAVKPFTPETLLGKVKQVLAKAA
jgi:two-component system chemotaxis response regulator CheY